VPGVLIRISRASSVVRPSVRHSRACVDDVVIAYRASADGIPSSSSSVSLSLSLSLSVSMAGVKAHAILNKYRYVYTANAGV